MPGPWRRLSLAGAVGPRPCWNAAPVVPWYKYPRTAGGAARRQGASCPLSVAEPRDGSGWKDREDPPALASRCRSSARAGGCRLWFSCSLKDYFGPLPLRGRVSGDSQCCHPSHAGATAPGWVPWGHGGSSGASPHRGCPGDPGSGCRQRRICARLRAAAVPGPYKYPRPRHRAAPAVGGRPGWVLGAAGARARSEVRNWVWGGRLPEPARPAPPRHAHPSSSSAWLRGPFLRWATSRAAVLPPAPTCQRGRGMQLLCPDSSALMGPPRALAAAVLPEQCQATGPCPGAGTTLPCCCHLVLLP